MREGYTTEKLKKAIADNKNAEKKFFNALLNICVLNGMVDWSDKDPKIEFKEIGELLITYMVASDIKVDK